jgi:hypothetical protein
MEDVATLRTLSGVCENGRIASWTGSNDGRHDQSVYCCRHFLIRVAWKLPTSPQWCSKTRISVCTHAIFNHFGRHCPRYLPFVCENQSNPTFFTAEHLKELFDLYHCESQSSSQKLYYCSVPAEIRFPPERDRRAPFCPPEAALVVRRLL